MKKGKKVYNLTIVFDDKTEIVEHLMEELYHDESSMSLGGALDIPESECPDAPPDMLREIISDYYLSLLDDSGIIGLA